MSGLKILVASLLVLWLFFLWAVLADEWRDDETSKVRWFLFLAVSGAPLVTISVVMFKDDLPF